MPSAALDPLLHRCILLHLGSAASPTALCIALCVGYLCPGGGDVLFFVAMVEEIVKSSERQSAGILYVPQLPRRGRGFLSE